MNTEAHLALGWILAHAGGRDESLSFRRIVTFAALAPDLDAISYVFGERAYANLHHALGHNIFFSITWSILCICVAWRGSIRYALKILLFTQLAFYSHYFGDYFFTRFPLEFFWPISHKGYVYSYRIGLDHPINLVFGYLSFVTFIVTGVIYKWTPIELFSPELDRRVVNLFGRRNLRCHVCGRASNERCVVCGGACCVKHGQIGKGFRVRCTICARQRTTVNSGHGEVRADRSDDFHMP